MTKHRKPFFVAFNYLEKGKNTNNIAWVYARDKYQARRQTRLKWRKAKRISVFKASEFIVRFTSKQHFLDFVEKAKFPLKR